MCTTRTAESVLWPTLNPAGGRDLATVVWCRYLGVDRAKPEDTLNGQLRIILHADQSKAAAWKWTQNPYGDGKVLHLAAMACKGCYLARSSSRTDNSYYLVASHDPGEALNVNVQPAAGYEEAHVTPE